MVVCFIWLGKTGSALALTEIHGAEIQIGEQLSEVQRTGPESGDYRIDVGLEIVAPQEIQHAGGTLWGNSQRSQRERNSIFVCLVFVNLDNAATEGVTGVQLVANQAGHGQVIVCVTAVQADALLQLGNGGRIILHRDGIAVAHPVGQVLVGLHLQQPVNVLLGQRQIVGANGAVGHVSNGDAFDFLVVRETLEDQFADLQQIVVFVQVVVYIKQCGQPLPGDAGGFGQLIDTVFLGDAHDSVHQLQSSVAGMIVFTVYLCHSKHRFLTQYRLHRLSDYVRNIHTSYIHPLQGLVV